MRCVRRRRNSATANARCSTSASISTGTIWRVPPPACRCSPPAADRPAPAQRPPRHRRRQGDQRVLRRSAAGCHPADHRDGVEQQARWCVEQEARRQRHDGGVQCAAAERVGCVDRCTACLARAVRHARCDRLAGRARRRQSARRRAGNRQARRACTGRAASMRRDGNPGRRQRPLRRVQAHRCRVRRRRRARVAHPRRAARRRRRTHRADGLAGQSTAAGAAPGQRQRSWPRRSASNIYGRRASNCSARRCVVRRASTGCNASPALRASTAWPRVARPATLAGGRTADRRHRRTRAARWHAFPASRGKGWQG
jgi:hypothetical protein